MILIKSPNEKFYIQFRDMSFNNCYFRNCYIDNVISISEDDDFMLKFYMNMYFNRIHQRDINFAFDKILAIIFSDKYNNTKYNHIFIPILCTLYSFNEVSFEHEFTLRKIVKILLPEEKRDNNHENVIVNMERIQFNLIQNELWDQFKYLNYWENFDMFNSCFN